GSQCRNLHSLRQPHCRHGFRNQL
ncbi:uncharacterized protein METZ01_LOCUS147217, partial [marine metagenome]